MDSDIMQSDENFSSELLKSKLWKYGEKEWRRCITNNLNKTTQLLTTTTNTNRDIDVEV